MKVGNQFSTENGRFLFLSFLLYFFLWIFSPGLSYYYFREKREKNDFDLRPVSVQIRIGGQVGGVLPRGRSYRPGLLWVGFFVSAVFLVGRITADYLRIKCGLFADQLPVVGHFSFSSSFPPPSPHSTLAGPLLGNFWEILPREEILWNILWDSLGFF